MEEKNWHKKQNETGQLGEDFVRFWCVSTNQTFKKELDELNYQQGIDCHIESVPTDVKNTGLIYLGNYRNVFRTRHPFKKGSLAMNYCILKINQEKTKFEIFYNGPVETHIKKFLQEDKTLEDLRKIIQKYDGTYFQQWKCTHPDSMLYKIKAEVSKILNPASLCNYYGVNEIGNGTIYLMNNDIAKSFNL